MNKQTIFNGYLSRPTAINSTAAAPHGTPTIHGNNTPLVTKRAALFLRDQNGSHHKTLATSEQALRNVKRKQPHTQFSGC
jgi:hypothetical protein